MGKATLVLVTLAALGLGSLVGVSLVDDAPDASVAPAVVDAALVSTGGAPAFRFLRPDDVPGDWLTENSGEPFTSGENFLSEPGKWKAESLEIELAGDARVEYKIFMSQGDAVLFNWSVDGEELYFDLHAHDDAFGDEFYTRYDDGRAIQRSGTIVAAYDGQHGWYWQNLEPEAATITLEVAGFYDEILEMDLQEE
jgi:hypothetical protein